MATIKQKRVLDKIVEYRGNIGKAMVSVGYSPATAERPKNLTESKGFKQLLEEKGLTPSLITEALVEDIKSKPRNRVKELSLGADILKMREREMGNQTDVVNLLFLITQAAANDTANDSETNPGGIQAQ